MDTHEYREEDEDKTHQLGSGFIEDSKINVKRLEYEVQYILDAFLYRQRYAHEKCSRLVKDLSTIVRDKIKDCIGDRLGT